MKTLSFLALILLGMGAFFMSDSKASPTLTENIDRALTKAATRRLIVPEEPPWVVMHGVIGFGRESKVLDRSTGQYISSLDYLLKYARYADMRIFQAKDGDLTLMAAPEVPGRPICKTYYQVQDHPDQYLMVFAFLNLPLTTKIATDQGDFTVDNLLRTSYKKFRPDQEISWTLGAYAHYLPVNGSWTNELGKEYTLEDLLRIALAQDPNEQTEGGTHQMYGIAAALKRLKETNPNAGIVREADLHLRGYTMRVERFQQKNGAFSQQLFQRSTAPRNPDELLNSTGHMLEWLAIYLTPAEQNEPWIREAIYQACNAIISNPIDSFGASGLYHAVHALHLLHPNIKPEL